MPNQQSLNLRGNQLTADDLEYLRSQTALSALALEETNLTDAGMESLKDLTDLTVLNLGGTQVGDAGLVYLHRLKMLRFLVLNHTRVTDAGLGHLAGLPQLELLGLKGTVVTAEAVARLQQLLSGCTIETDHPAAASAAGESSASVDENVSRQPAGAPQVVATATSTDDSIPVRFGRYYVIKALGQGRMGIVYLAHDEQLDRKVALKIPKLTVVEGGDPLDRFYREARLAARLHHRNICPVYDIGEIDGRAYIAMAYIEGRELTRFINPEKLQPEKVVATVIRKLALALREAHSNGVIHRDLKPANVIIDRQHEPVVMDFGLARTIIDGDARMTESGAILGTPAYMSPEQVEGDVEELGPPSDVFSLGVLFYELLTGYLPFRGSVGSVMTQIVTKDPPKPSELRPGLQRELETICLQMLSKRVEDRYKSMSGVAATITEYLKEVKGRS